jgi:tRNA dimethylallyltransferase
VSVSINQSDKINLAAVVGPTASGKTALAVSLALSLCGEVVSCDSMQIYSGMEIATAAPTMEEMRGVPHHFVSCFPASERFSVAKYCSLAHGRIREISERGKLPILCGGTGLYYSSLTENLSFAEVPADDALRRELKAQYSELGGEYLLAKLGEFDSETAALLHPNQEDKIIRAIEIYTLGGITISEQKRRSRENPPPYRVRTVGLTYRNRATLYERINRRVDLMIEQGLVKEAEQMLKNCDMTTAAGAIGHKELIPYLRGEIPLSAAADKIKMESRRYAKRQLTWFRRRENIHWLYREDFSSDEQLSEAAREIITAPL